ncbi:HAD family hydrolase [Thermodesulfobacteriota bacterium]
MDFKAVIFDLDGTLLDTLEDIANSANNILARHGFPTHDWNDYRDFVGDGLGMLVKRILPEDKQDNETVRKYLEEYIEEYSQNWNIATKPYYGVAETLDELTALHIRLAVLSNKRHDYTKKCVTEFLPGWTFDMVLGQRDGIARKPDPIGALQITEFMNLSPESILYVGDTAIDMKTAIAAGMYPVGALWGFRSMKELKSSGAKALIEQPQEILSLLDKTGYQKEIKPLASN